MTVTRWQAVMLGFLAFGLSLGVQVALLAAPLLTMHVYDGVLSSRSSDTLLVLAAAWLVAVVMAGLLRNLRAALLAAIAERIAHRLQFRSIGAALHRALQGDRAAGLQALADAGEVRRLLGGATLSDVLDLVALPAALLVLFLLHPLYGWTGLGGCALLMVLGALADRTTRDAVRQVGAVQARCVADLTGRMRQAELLDCLGMLPAVLRRWEPTYLAMLAAQDAAQRRARSIGGLAGFAQHSMLLGMTVAGGWLVAQNLASPGSILAASLLAGMAAAPGAKLVSAWREWAFGTVALGRLRSTLAISGSPGAAPMATDAPPGLMLEALSLEVPGSGERLLAGLTLHLKPGQLLLVEGPNGTGKSSLLRAVLGLVPPAAGRARLDGQDTHRAPRGLIGPRIGYAPQGAPLLECSVLENIARLSDGPAAKAIAAARAAGAHETIGRLPEGYSSPAGPSAGLSGGQRQAISMARAMFGDPALLVLDEPEAGLDGIGLAALHRSVAAAKARGVMVVLVSHQPAHWAALADVQLTLGGEGGSFRLAARDMTGAA
jgi:ATP-binding cassette subfamily C protein